VLVVTAIRKSGTLREAIDAAYSAVQLLSFEGMHARSDIGQKGLLTGGR
jgi:phosphoribosylamine-glycine ligase